MGLFKKLKSTLGEYKEVYDNAKAEQEAKLEREKKFGDLFYGDVPDNADDLLKLPFKVTEDMDVESIAKAIARRGPAAPETSDEVVYVDKGDWQELDVYYHGPFYKAKASKSLVFDLVADAPDMDSDYGVHWTSGASDEEIAVAWNGELIGVLEDYDGLFSQIERSGIHLQLRGWTHGVDRYGETSVEIRVPASYKIVQWLTVRRVSGDQIKLGYLEKLDYVEIGDERWEELGLANGEKAEISVEIVPPSANSTAKPRVALSVNGTVLRKRTDRWQFYDDLAELADKKMTGYAYKDDYRATRGRIYIKGTSSHHKIHY